MNVKNVEKENGSAKVTVEIAKDEFQTALDKAYAKIRKDIMIPGFRKGKAPRKVIENYYGTGVLVEEAFNDVLPDSYDKAVEETGAKPVAQPEIDIESIGAGEDCVYTATVYVRPEVTLGQYKGIAAPAAKWEVTAEEIDREIDRAAERVSRMVDIEDRAAEMGDTANIDFEGFDNGEAFEGGKGENFSLALGSGQFIPGFEDQVVGHEVGDEFEISVKFPEDYQAEELKGKDATFKIKLHQIKRKELPTLDDEFAKDVSEFDTLDEYKNSLREKLQSDREKQEEMNVENQIFDALIEKVQGEIPEEMYEQEVEESINNFAYRLQSQGLNLETYLKYTGMDVNAIKEQFRPQSEKQLKLRLALEKIAELENLEVSDEAVEEEYEKLAKQYNMEVAQIKNLVAETQIRADLKNQKAIDFVKENASVKAEKPAKKTTRRKSTKKAAEEKTEETAEAKTEE